jgi:hypothetical protein
MREFLRIAEQAERQAGMVSRRQLLANGVRPGVVLAATRSGRLLSVHHGVYRLAGAPITEKSLPWAAILWSGFEAVLSHRSAGWWGWKLDGLGRKPPQQIELITARDCRWVAPRNIRVRRVVDFDFRLDSTIHNSLPCTTLARTIADLAAVLEPQALEQAFDCAVKRVDDFDGDVLRVLRRIGNKGRAGNAALRAVANRNPTTKTGSPLEVIVRDALTNAGIPLPMSQLATEDRHGDQAAVVDFSWPDRLVVLFVHSNLWHRSRAEVEKDRTQSNALVAAGWRVLTVSSRRLLDDGEAFFAELRATLALDARPSFGSL